MKHAPLAAFLLTAFGIQAAGSADQAVERLVKEALFAFGGVGFAGVTSTGEKEYREILARPTAEADFEKVFQSGSVAAKCYALAGLHILNREKCQRLSLSLRDSDRRVATMRGCILSREPVAAIVDRIEAGQYGVSK